jgi:hypothetical protein
MLREDPQNKLFLIVGLKCGRSIAIHSGWQPGQTANNT